MRRTKEKKGFRIPVFDIVVSLVLLGAIAASVIVAVRFEHTETVAVEYTLVFERVPKGLSQLVAGGKTVYDERGLELGTIASVRADGMQLYTLDRRVDEENPIYLQRKYTLLLSDQYDTVTVTVLAEAEYDGTVYRIGGNTLAVGNTFAARLRDFYGEARVSALRARA